MVIPSEFPPIHYHLGGHNVHWDETAQALHIGYAAKHEFTNPSEVVEGGMVVAMLDDVMGILCDMKSTPKVATTVNLNTTFLRPCRVGEVETKAWLVKQGSRVISVESEAWQDNKLVVKSSASFLVL